MTLYSVIEGLKYMQSHEVRPDHKLPCLRLRSLVPPTEPHQNSMDADLIDSHLQWAKAEGDVVTVGITDHAQAELGDVVYVELPEVGSTVTHKATFGVVESVKVRTPTRVFSVWFGFVLELHTFANHLYDTPLMAKRVL